jgi:carbamoyl-phosphate synthase small subunit
MKSVLVLEDGTYFPGEGFGQKGETAGEVVFNTCMTGYQEITTDPSYNGQIVTMTYPLVGNYGFNGEDNESYKTHVQGFIVKELCAEPNNWRNSTAPDEYFKKNNIIGLKGIDTRALTQHIRSHAACSA